MAAYEILLNNLAPEGQTFIVDDQAGWTGPISECGMDGRILEPLEGKVTLLPQDEGCLVRGHLTGKVAVPCNRCAEDAILSINGSFDSFEPYPDAENEEAEKSFDNEADELIVKKAANGAPVISLAGLLWEEFVLSLPVKPLCRPDCKGLCPQCGKNLNDGTCSCIREEGDPRLAALRGLKIKRN